MQYTPQAVVDELDERLKGLAVLCVEGASNLAQASLNKRLRLAHSEAAIQSCNDAPPCDASSPSHPGEQLPSGQGPSNPRKHSLDPPGGGSGDDDNDGGDEISGHGGNGGQGRTGHKRPKKGELEHPARMSCPFRKRNPLRFNVRDRQNCALQGFADMARLKRHIKECHTTQQKNTNQCLRCLQTFESRTELSDHINQDPSQLCESQKPPVSVGRDDPENDIAPDIVDKLTQRKNSQKIDTWEALWKTLFPKDNAIGSSSTYPPAHERV